MNCGCIITTGALLAVCLASGLIIFFPDEFSELGIHQAVENLKSHVEGLLSKTSHETSTDRLFTVEELRGHKHEYLAIVGEVYDVSSAKQHYGQDGGYSFFTGLDGTRAFSTGDFTEKGLIPDVDGLASQEVKAIEDFRLMYLTQYKYLGKLAGHYYTNTGSETENKNKYRQLLLEAEKSKLKQDEELRKFPPCNSEYKQTQSGAKGRVWCSNLSGGISRDWVGVPRKLYSPSKDYRCACIRTSGPAHHTDNLKNNNRGDLDNPMLREYENCEPTSTSCYI